MVVSDSKSLTSLAFSNSVFTFFITCHRYCTKALAFAINLFVRFGIHQTLGFQFKVLNYITWIVIFDHYKPFEMRAPVDPRRAFVDFEFSVWNEVHLWIILWVASTSLSFFSSWPLVPEFIRIYMKNFVFFNGYKWDTRPEKRECPKIQPITIKISWNLCPGEVPLELRLLGNFVSFFYAACLLCLWMARNLHC